SARSVFRQVTCCGCSRWAEGMGRPLGPITGLTVLGEADGATIRIVDNDPSWPQRFEVERDRIVRALGPVARRIEHVGSTSVSGLASKPVVDITVTVGTPTTMLRSFLR